MSTVWTRVTGWLGMLVAAATLLWWQVPHGLEGTSLRYRLLLPLAALGGCLLLWLTASAFAARRRRRLPRPEKPQRTRESRALSTVLAFGVTLLTSAALLSGVGPDGEEGRRTQRIQQAGGGVYDTTVVKVLSEPRAIGGKINDHDLYRATLLLRLPYATGVQELTVPDVETVDEPAAGDAVPMLLAPERPDLGALPYEPGQGFTLLWLWILAIVGGCLLSGYFSMQRSEIHRLRRFRAVAHLPALALLGLGLLLQLPVVLHRVGTLPGWLLCLLAATTPAAAAWWLSRTVPEEQLPETWH